MSDDIKAGGAYVEVRTKDEAFYQGLDQEESYLQSWAARVAQIGAVVTAGLGAAAASRSYFVRQYAEAGSRINRLAQESGQTAEQVSILDYVAGQTGQSFEQLSKLVAGGLDPASQQRFANLSSEARRLGLVMSTADSQGASLLSRAFIELNQTISALGNKLGSAFAPEVLMATKWMTNAIAPVSRWIDANKGLLASLGMVAGFGLSVAASITSIAGAIAVFGPLVPVVAGVGAALMAVGAVSIAVYNNWSRLVSFALSSFEQLATFVGLGSSTMASNWVSYLGGMLTAMRGFGAQVMGIFGAVANAIAAGEMAAAWDVLYSAALLGWTTLTSRFQTLWLATVEGFSIAWADAVFNFQSAFIEAFAFIESAWGAASNWMSKTFSDAMAGAAILASRAWVGFTDAVFTPEAAAVQRENQEQLEAAIVAQASEQDQQRNASTQGRQAEAAANRLSALERARASRDQATRAAQQATDGAEDPATALAAARARLDKALATANSFKPFEFQSVDKLASLQKPDLVSKRAAGASGTFSGFNAGVTLGANNYDADTAKNTGQTVALLQQILQRGGFR